MDLPWRRWDGGMYWLSCGGWTTRLSKYSSSLAVIAELQQICPTLSMVDLAWIILNRAATFLASSDSMSDTRSRSNGPAMSTRRFVKGRTRAISRLDVDIVLV